MDNFNKIIKEKVEQFDVPFNDAHWAEMEGKLNTLRVTKIKNTILGSAAIIALVSISGYFIYSNNTAKPQTNTVVAAKKTNTTPTEKLTIDSEKTENIENTSSENLQIKTNTNLVKSEPSLKKEEKPEIDTKTLLDDKEKKNILAPNNNSTAKVNAEFLVFNNKVCLGEKVSFESIESNNQVSYIWNFGDGTISYEKNPSHFYESSNIYTVSLTLLNRKTGEETTTIQNDVVTILQTPKADFNYSEISEKNESNKLKYPYTTFTINNIEKDCSNNWSFGNGEKSATTEGKTIYEKAGEYFVQLFIKNNTNECSQTISKKITIKNGLDLFAPTAIKPNSEIDENKVFIPGALLGWDIKFEMVILDKAGKTLYTSTDKNEPWNGRLNNTGQVLNSDVYLWQVITYDAEGNAYQHHGKITLVK